MAEAPGPSGAPSQGPGAPPTHERGGPRPLNAKVSAAMARMPRRDTKPEVAVRRELHRRGLRFRVVVAGLPGRPDVVLTRARLAVFIDGCFWHRCPVHATAPRNNAAWWGEKLEGNVARDRRKDAALEAAGWTPLHFWEHQSAVEVADAIEVAWRGRTGR